MGWLLQNNYRHFSRDVVTVELPMHAVADLGGGGGGGGQNPPSALEF